MLDHADRGRATVILLMVLGSVAVSLAAHVPFLVTLTRCLRRVRPANRRLPPWTVWLMLVPGLNVVWRFVLVVRVATSLELEHLDRRLPTGNDSFGKAVGLAWCVLSLLSYTPLLLVAGVAGAPCPLLFMMYWARVAGYAAALSPGDRREPGRRPYNRYLDDDD